MVWIDIHAVVFAKTHEDGCGGETDGLLVERCGHLTCLEDASVEGIVGVLGNGEITQVDGVDGTHQHAALPKAAEETGGVVHAFEGDGSEDGVAVGETVPVIVPSRTGSEVGEGHRTELVVVLDLGPPFPSRCGDEFCDLVLVELLDVFLRGAHHGETELDGVGARSREMGRNADRKNLAM